MPSFQSMVIDQYTSLPLIPTSKDCIGKTFIITGANQGIGYECTKHLVSLGASRVIIGVRSLKKGETAKSTIEKETGRKDVIDIWHLDLCSYDSVKEFAEKVKGLERLDGMVENAALALGERTVAEGLEMSLTVNVISTMLMAVLVLPKLKESAKRFGTLNHLTFVGSGVSMDAKGELEKFDGDIIDGVDNGPMDNRYPVTKLLLLYAVRQFALLHPVSETGVTMNYIDPGLCKTDLCRHAGFMVRLIIRTMQLLLGRTSEAGSRTLLHGAFAPKETHGHFLGTCADKENITVQAWVKNATGAEIQRRVWDSVSSKLKVIQPGCI